MLPVSPNWKKHCYVDFYEAPVEWMEGSSLVTINNEQFLIMKIVISVANQQTALVKER